MRAILTFHSVDDSGSVISYPPAAFRALIQALAHRGIPILDLPTLLDPNCLSGVAITFDDGMASVRRHALPVLRDHGAPAHLFLTTDPVGAAEPWPAQPTDIPSFPMLDWDGVEDLVAGGFFIENHTRSHPDFRTLSDAQRTEECGASDERIEARTGRRPRYFAYPFGYYDAASVEFARGRYEGTVTTELRALSAREDAALLPRLDTFYLQTRNLFDHLESPPVQAYLSARSFLRSVRGSQVIPDEGLFAAARRAFRG